MQGDTVKDLARRIAKERDDVDVAVFDKLASFGDEASFRALEKSLERLKRDRSRAAALLAFRLYAGRGELEAGAIALLEEAALRSEGGEPLTAVRALIALGDESVAALERIARGAEDAKCRGVACDALVPHLGGRGDRESIQLILRQAAVRGGAEVRYVGVPAGVPRGYADWTHREVVRAVLARDAGQEKRALLYAKLHAADAPRVWKLLLLEILAELDEPDVDPALARVLSDRDASVVLEAIAIVDERGGRWEDLELELRPLMQHSDVAVRRAAVVAMGHHGLTDSAWQREALALAHSKDASLRMGVATTLAELRTPEAIEELHALLSDRLFAVRVEALEQTVLLRRKESVPILIERLEQETGRLREDVLNALRLLTGLDHGRPAARWKRWWADRSGRFELPPYHEAVNAERERRQHDTEGGTRATSFYGVRVTSERVIFVLDVSGSMRLQLGRRPDDPRPSDPGARTRMDRAKRELSDVLRRLPEGLLFNIIFFEEEVTSFEKKLVRMSRGVRQRSMRFVADQYALGSTALYPALQLAFADPLVDTIYLLSDGAPTDGEITDITAIRAEVRRWNSARKVRIHGITIGQDSTLLRWLTEDTGGRYLRVD
ncbi:MAG: HEAT repeat domain-containing protein [Planctomycetota bacterium]|nr:HEAT repeat domain-containing protein [Planctomycetota bacterium]